MNIGVGALARFYKENDIRYLTPKYHYHRRESSEVKLEQQQDFVLKHVRLLKEEKELVYFDESSFHLWMKRPKLWRPANIPMHCHLQQDRGESFTVLGAISNKSSKAYIEFGCSTNTETVTKFFRNYLKDHPGAVIVMDNHRSHHSRAV